MPVRFTHVLPLLCILFALPLAAQDTPAPTLRLSDAIILTLPPGWEVRDEALADSNTTLLHYPIGAVSAALISITLVEGDPFDYVLYREALFPALGALYLGRAFNVEYDLLTNMLDSDGMIDYLNLSSVETPRGSLFLVRIAEETFAIVVLSIASIPGADPQALLADAETLARSLVRQPRPVVTMMIGEISIDVLPATCQTLVNSAVVTPNRPNAAFDCPAGCAARGEWRVWGTDVYTDDSALCVAAVHAGAIDDATGGMVLVTYARGQDAYPASTRNGVTTLEWGAWGGSFTVAPLK
jgi:hypothetical protein